MELRTLPFVGRVFHCRQGKPAAGRAGTSSDTFAVRVIGGGAKARATAARVLEKKYGSTQFAVVSLVTSDEGWTLQWRDMVGYKSAYSWVKKAFEVCPDIDWRLDAVLPTGTGGEIKQATSTGEGRSAAASGLSVGGHTFERMQLAPQGEEASSSCGRTTVSVTTQTPVEPRVSGDESCPCFATTWLVIKACEQLREVGPPSGESYILGEKLGSGVFAEVFSCRHKTSSQHFVMKRLKVSVGAKSGDAQMEKIEYIREVELLSRLSHPNIVQIADVAAPLGLVLVPAGSNLQSLLKLRGASFDLESARKITLQILEGCAYIHSQHVCHTDIKPENICLSDSGCVRLVDFGNSIVSLPTYRSCPCEANIRKTGLRYTTLWYRSIELLLGDVGFAAPADLWSVACVVAELLSKAVLFASKSAIGMVFKILSVIGSPQTPDQWNYAKSLPLWSSQMPQYPKGVIPLLQVEGVGAIGTFVEEVLQLLPSQRPTARASVALLSAEKQQAAKAPPNHNKRRKPL